MNTVPPLISALYAALSAVLVVVLVLRVAMLRNRNKIGIGDGQLPALAKAIRVHGNAVETLPMALLLLLILELSGGNTALLHGCGILLLLSRVLHAVGLSQHSGYSFGRFFGTLGTLLAMLILAGALIWRVASI